MRSDSGSMGEFEVDYVRNTVKINSKNHVRNPVKRFMNLFTTYCLNLPAFYFTLLVSLYMGGSVYPLISHISQTQQSGYYFMVFFISMLYFGFMLSIYHLISPKYADIFFAKFNTWFKDNRKIEINHIDRKSFTFYDPKFRNVFIKYEVTEEFSKYLDKIRVIQLRDKYEFRNMNRYWALSFDFKKIPKKGGIKLKYI